MSSTFASRRTSPSMMMFCIFLVNFDSLIASLLYFCFIRFIWLPFICLWEFPTFFRNFWCLLPVLNLRQWALSDIVLEQSFVFLVVEVVFFRENSSEYVSQSLLADTRDLSSKVTQLFSNNLVVILQDIVFQPSQSWSHVCHSETHQILFNPAVITLVPFLAWDDMKFLHIVLINVADSGSMWLWGFLQNCVKFSFCRNLQRLPVLECLW